MTYPAGEPDVIDLGGSFYLRPLHRYTVQSPPAPPLMDPEIIGYDWWHACPADPEGAWVELDPAKYDAEAVISGKQVLECAACGIGGYVSAAKVSKAGKVTATWDPVALDVPAVLEP